MTEVGYCLDGDWRIWQHLGDRSPDLQGQRGKPQPREKSGDKASWCLQQIKGKMNKSKKWNCDEEISLWNTKTWILNVLTSAIENHPLLFSVA